MASIKGILDGLEEIKSRTMINKEYSTVLFIRARYTAISEEEVISAIDKAVGR